MKTPHKPAASQSDEGNLTPVRRSAEHGFTLVELMVVIVILGLLATIVAVNVIPSGEKAKVIKAKTDISTIEGALDTYKLQNDIYPTTSQGLQALVSRPTATPIPSNWKPYVEKLPNDPWGRPYQYFNPGIRGEIDVLSLGADGQPGGEGNDADIGSWQ